MTNTPRTKLMPDTAEAGEESPSDPRELVEEVLREARSLLGQTNQDSTVMKVGLFAESTTESSVKHAESARDLGEHGPMVDLFGSDEPPAFESELDPEPEVDSGPTEFEASPPTSQPKSDAAIALDTLLAERVAQESEASEESAMVADGVSQRRAAEAERSAVDALDDLDDLESSPLRTTAGEVEAEVSLDPLSSITPAELARAENVRFEMDHRPRHSIESTAEIAGDLLEPTRAPVSEPTTIATADTHFADLTSEVPPSRVSPMPSEDLAVSETAAPSMAVRWGAMPFRLVPNSLHRVVTITALSLAIWVPVVWTYAVFGPEFFTGAVSDPGADVREPLDPDGSNELSGPNEPPGDQRQVATVTDALNR
jgi:hypothetical protein